MEESGSGTPGIAPVLAGHPAWPVPTKPECHQDSQPHCIPWEWQIQEGCEKGVRGHPESPQPQQGQGWEEGAAAPLPQQEEQQLGGLEPEEGAGMGARGV